MTSPQAVTTSASWEDYLEIFYAPSKVFARRGARWAGPLVVLVILTALVVLGTIGLVGPLFEADSARVMAKKLAGMPPEQREQAEAAAGQIGRFIPVFIIAATAILPIVLGIILWLVGKMLGAVQQLGGAIMVAVFSYFPRVLAGAVMGLMAAVLPEEKLTGVASVSLSPARFLNPATHSPELIALAMRLDVFVIWTTVLLALGLQVTGKISPEKAVIAGCIMWLIGSIQPIFALLRS